MRTYWKVDWAAVGVILAVWFLGWMIVFTVVAGFRGARGYDPPPVIVAIWLVPVLVIGLVAGMIFGIRYARPIVRRERIPVTEDLRTRSKRPAR